MDSVREENKPLEDEKTENYADYGAPELPTKANQTHDAIELKTEKNDTSNVEPIYESLQLSAAQVKWEKYGGSSAPRLVNAQTQTIWDVENNDSSSTCKKLKGEANIEVKNQLKTEPTVDYSKLRENQDKWDNCGAGSGMEHEDSVNSSQHVDDEPKIQLKTDTKTEPVDESYIEPNAAVSPLAVSQIKLATYVEMADMDLNFTKEQQGDEESMIQLKADDKTEPVDESFIEPDATVSPLAGSEIKLEKYGDESETGDKDSLKTGKKDRSEDEPKIRLKTYNKTEPVDEASIQPDSAVFPLTVSQIKLENYNVGSGMENKDSVNSSQHGDDVPKILLKTNNNNEQVDEASIEPDAAVSPLAVSQIKLETYVESEFSDKASTQKQDVANNYSSSTSKLQVKDGPKPTKPNDKSDSEPKPEFSGLTVNQVQWKNEHQCNRAGNPELNDYFRIDYYLREFLQGPLWTIRRQKMLPKLGYKLQKNKSQKRKKAGKSKKSKKSKKGRSRSNIRNRKRSYRRKLKKF